MKKVIIIGAGPAGLTAAYELLSNSKEFDVTIFEEGAQVGGIAKTVNYNGNRMDMGGHRFFSKSPKVNKWWENILPMQGAPSFDDIKLERNITLAEGGPDPEQTDDVMLQRTRVSRIYFDGKFYDYPISLKPETFRNMGFLKTVQVIFSYMAALVHKLPEDNLENFYINRFGRKLYSLFFEYYTENLWGRHPSEIDASWGAQRVKGISVTAIIKDIFSKILHIKRRRVETSLIEQFKYPKLGPGELWEKTCEKIIGLGGNIVMNSKVTGIVKDNDNRITAVIYEDKDGTKRAEGDIFISSMPIKDLISGMNGVPEEIHEIAEGLPYRDYMTAGVLVNKLRLKNKTKFRTIGDIVPDCWVYVQDKNVRLGRFQIFNNWSPYMVKDIENTVWIGLEYFVKEGDTLWSMPDKEFAELGISEMIKLGIIENAGCVIDTHTERVKKAYPAYFDTYDKIDELRDYIDTIDNLYLVGRNGQHRYNNLDHSMLTSFEAVNCIMNNIKDRSAIWNVNAEKEYHEEKQNED